MRQGKDQAGVGGEMFEIRKGRREAWSSENNAGGGRRWG